MNEGKLYFRQIADNIVIFLKIFPTCFLVNIIVKLKKYLESCEDIL